MLLTRVQAYILDLLCKLKYMKKSQLMWFLRRTYKQPDDRFERDLRQLRYLNRIWFAGDCILLPERKSDDEMITAVDIMIEFCGDCLPSFAVGVSPCKLVFFTQTSNEKVRVFKLFFVPKGKETIISIEAQKQNQPPDHTLLFFLQDKAQMPKLCTTHDTYFVLRNINGKYEFFSREQS